MDYAIGELARRTGYAVQTLRYYEQTGLMPKPRRTEGGQRRYSEAQLKRLLFIRHARDLGFEVEHIRSLLELAAHPEQPCASVDAIAKAHLAAIDDKIARLRALRSEVARMLRTCIKGRIAECKVIDVRASNRYSHGVIITVCRPHSWSRRMTAAAHEGCQFWSRAFTVQGA